MIKAKHLILISAQTYFRFAKQTPKKTPIFGNFFTKNQN